jgi:hypothetical protein
VTPSRSAWTWTRPPTRPAAPASVIGKLTEPETTLLVHFGKDRTQQWTPVRLEPPEDNQ